MLATALVAVAADGGGVSAARTPGELLRYDFGEASGSTVGDSGSGAPMDLTIADPSNVTWLPGEGLRIDSSTEIFSDGAASKLISAVKASGEFTVEAWVTPAPGSQTGPARIISNGPNAFQRNLMLGQGAYSTFSDDVYSLRTRTSSSTGGGPDLFSTTGVIQQELTHVVASRNAAGQRIMYVNGQQVSTDNLAGGVNKWNNSYPLVLGNVLPGNRPWLGTFCQVAVYDAVLTPAQVDDNFDAGCGVPVGPNTDPTIDDVVDQTSAEGDLVSLQVTGQDVDGDTLTYAALNLPSGLSINASTGLISGTLTQTAATGAPYTVEVRVSDGKGGSASDSFQWNVDAVNIDPVFPVIGTQSSSEGQSVSLGVVATDADGDALTYSATGLPTGLDIDTTTGLISGIVDDGTAPASPYSVEVTVDDGNTGTDAVSFQWIIDVVTGPTPLVNYDFNEGSGTTVADTGSGAPLDLAIADPGNVSWIPGGGLAIDSITTIASNESSKIDDAVTASGAFTVEAWITPAPGEQSGPARIVENGPTAFARNFMLGQGAYGSLSDDVFSIRTRTNTKTSGTPELFSDTGVTSTELTHVVAGRDAAGNRTIYVNGVLSSSDVFTGTTGNWNGTYPLVLGNTGRGNRGWLGSFCRVSVYDVSLSAAQVASNFAGGCGEPEVPNSDPVLGTIGAQADAEGDTPIVDVDATDVDTSDILSFSATGLPDGLSIDTASGSISGTVSQTAATGSVYDVTVTVVDGNGGSDSETFGWTISAVNIDPELAAIGDVETEAGGTVDLQATATDVDGDALTFSAVGLPTGLSMSTAGLVTGTVDAGVANGSVFTTTVTVVDGQGGADAETFDWTIVANTPPSFDSPVPGDQVSAEGAVVSVTFAATDTDGDPIAFSADGLPAGLTIDPETGEVSGTLTQTAGGDSPYAVTITVQDSRGGQAETSLEWTVGVVPIAPELETVGDQNDDEGDVVSIDVDATDLDGDVLTFGATGLPPSLTIDPITGEITGTIDAGAAAGSPYAVEITVDDGTGQSDSETIAWTVSVNTGPPALVRYEFNEGSGTTVADTGTGTPLDLTIADPANVTWIPGGGLSVDEITTIASTESSKVVDAVQASGEFTIEAWVRSSLDEQTGPARLVSNGPDPFARNFMLGQGAFGSNPNDVYSFRSRTQSKTGGTPELFSSTGTAQLDQLTHVVATRDADGDRIVYIDGIESSSDEFTGGVGNWNAGYPLTLANVATGNRGWVGTLCEVAVYDVVLSPAEVAANNDAGCDLPAEPAEALVQITPGGSIDATTFGDQTITVTNNGAATAPKISKVEFDARGSLIPDATFDPIGTAGDEGTQCLDVSDEGGTGYVVPDDNCTDPFTIPHEDDPGVEGNGNDGMTLEFTDFGVGESIVFGVDVDPTSIQGVQGSGGSGAVSGLELTGTLVTITFSDGQVLSNQIFGDGSQGGGQAVVAATKGVTAPTGIELVGVAATPTVFPNGSKVAVVDGVGPQVVEVTGPAGASVTLLDADGEMQSPTPFDLDPYESDALVAVSYLTGTIGQDGTLDFPVDIDNTAVLHHFVATIDDGANGPLSEQLIVAVDSPSSALIQVTPNSGLGASTFTDGTMSIANTGAAGEASIASVEFDLRGSIVPDATFDPNGVAGDTTPKCLVIAGGGAATGYVTPGDNCNDPFAVPHEDEPGVPGEGFDVMTLDFTDFGPGEAISFAVDIDATSIQGVVGSGGAGAVSGLELTGSLVTVTFDDGVTETAVYSQIFGDGSAGGGVAVVDGTTDVLAPPAIEMVGVTTTPTVFTNGSIVGSVPVAGPQTVRVAGAEGDSVTLLQMTGDFVTDPAFDVDDFESDTAVAVDYFTGVVGADGFVDIAVDIAADDVLYHYTAIIGDGSDGASTQLVIGVGLDVNAPAIDPIDDVSVDAGDVIDIPVSATSPNAETIALSIGSTPDIEVSGAQLTDNGDGTGSIDWATDTADVGTYEVTVTATTASGSSSTTFSIAVLDPDATVLYRVNAGGPEIAATDGGTPWSEDQATAGGDAGGPALAGTPSEYWVAGVDKTYGTADAIDVSALPEGTIAALFQTERYNPADTATEDMVYEFAVGSGQAYEVDLYFAEIFATDDDIREFTVNIEGEDVLVDYDVHELVGHDTGVIATFVSPIVAQDDNLTITFTSQIENAKVNAIEVRTAGPPPTDVPPLVDAIDDQSVAVGASLVVPISTTEFDGDTVTIEYSSNPDPASFTTLDDTGNGTGTLTFEPVAGDAGTYTVVVTATDKDGSDTEVFSLEVVEPIGNVFARINAGGPLVPSIDEGPEWEQDNNASPSDFLDDGGSNGNSGGAAVEPNASVPAYVPGAVLDTERWSSSGFGYDIPVPSGTQVFVRLFLGNNFAGTSEVGQRVFDIAIDGVVVDDDLDLVAEYGDQLAGMREYLVTSDGTVDIDFTNVVENPLVNAIEVAAADSSPDVLGASPTSVDFGITLTGGSSTETIVVSNLGFEAGDPDITVTGVTVNGGGEFTTDFVGPVLLGAGSSDSFDVTFAPTTGGDQTGSLTIEHTGTNTPLVIDLIGDSSNNIPVSFTQTGLSGESSNNPTSLQFGPDGRLYVAQQDATIKAYTVERNSATDYAVTATETINVVKNGIVNHDDDGSVNNTTARQMTGLLVTGTPSAPVIYATSSDSRISVGNDSGLDTNSGVISRLTKNGASWDRVDIVRGLPRSEENHSTNGLALDPSTNTLFVMQGGHANKGAPGNNFSGTPEYYLSGAMLSVDLDDIDAMGTFTDDRNGAEVAYDLRTLDDPSRPNIDNSDPDFPYPVGHPQHGFSIDVGDPFGGNNSLNQAVPEPDGPVQIYSAGYRNAFDVVFTTQGRLYTSDNGPNGGWGGVPLSYDSTGAPIATGAGPYTLDPGDYCTNEFNDADSAAHGDTLHFVSAPGYYGGHPAPIRAFPELSRVIVYEEQGAWTETANYNFMDLLPEGLSSSDFVDDPIQCDYTSSDPGKYLDIVGASTNGITEYTASNFGGKLQGNILTASFNGNIYSYDINAAGDSVDVKTSLFSGFGSQPLDVIAQGDGDPFPGTVWSVAYGADTIVVFEPSDSSSCTGADDIALDEDNDGFSNADEIDAGTDPCSAGDKPTDNDGDNISDVNDPDDDNDGIDDVVDEFAVDPDNGLTTSIPVLRPFENNDPGTFLFGLGLTGLMTNGTTDYLDQFDTDNLAAGGNGGELGVENITAGDAYQTDNTQENAFQYGVDADTSTAPFVVTTEIGAPIFGGATPVNFQAMGLQIGAGDQDNYLKLVVSANGGAGGVQALLEVDGTATQTTFGAADIGADVLATTAGIELALVVDPTALTAQPQVQIDGGSVVDLGAPIDIPLAWLDPSDENGLAVGVISTSTQATPFDALWSYLDVTFVSDGNEAPTIDPISDDTVAEGDAFAYEIGAFDGDGDDLTFDLSGEVPAGMTIVEPSTISWTTDLDDSGTYDITVEVSDGVNPAVTTDFALAVTQTDSGTVLRRINAGGPEVAATDGGPVWSANPNPNTLTELVAGGGNTFGPGTNHSPITDIGDPSVPSSTPVDVFNTERWDPTDAPEMAWKFAVDEGALIELRIGHGEIYGPATGRDYGLVIDGVTVDTNITPNALGFGAGFVTDYVVTADADGLDVEFVHGLDNPNPKSFEIIELTAAPNTDPTIDSITPSDTVAVTPGVAIPTVTVSASDVDGDVPALSTDGTEPTGIVFVDNGDGTATFTGSTTDAAGQYPVVVTATDDQAATTTATVTFEVSELVDAPPTFDADPSDGSTFEGDAYSQQIQASDDGTITYSLSGDAPIGMTIDANGLIEWESDLAASGIYDIVVELDDGSNPTASAGFTLTVAQTAPGGNALFRVNAGGPTLAAADGSFPDWGADTAAVPSIHYTGGGNGFYTGQSNPAAPFDRTHPTVPSTGPDAMYNTERYGDMTYDFPVQAGTDVEVRLHLNETFQNAPGGRSFDVIIEGVLVADDIDPIVISGAKNKPLVLDFLATSDGVLDVDIVTEVDNGSVKGIEVIGVGGNRAIEITGPSDGSAFGAETVTVEWMFNGYDEPGEHAHFSLSSDGGTTFGPATDPANAGTVNGAGTHNTLYRDDTTSIDLSGLATGDYIARVQVADNGHVAYLNAEATSTVAFSVDTAVAPVAPTGVSATDGDGLVDLDWDDDGNTTGFEVYRSSTSPVAVEPGNLVGSPATSDYSDATVVNGDLYFYVVVGVNALGSSPASDEVSARPLPDTTVIERINAGGGLVASTDIHQDWEADTAGANHPTLSDSGGNQTSTTSAVTGRDASVADYVPAGIYTSNERWAQNTATGMTYSIPVTAGQTVDVRLFLSNHFAGSSALGAREFDVTIEGALVLDAFGPVAAYGHQNAGMERFVVTDDGDGVITITFNHVSDGAGGFKDNPNVNGIEVRETV